jgi:monoterpene epsilon-lactone hydrolase
LRAGAPAPAALVERRTAIAGMPSDPPSGAAVAIGAVAYGGVDCIVCEPAAPLLTIVHFHGGGYRMGTPRGWVPFAARLAASTRTRVVVPDYRLAPEHPFRFAARCRSIARAALSCSRPGWI